MRAAIFRPLAILVLLTLLPLAPQGHASSVTVGQWTPTTPYPLQIAGESCFVDSGNVNCVGGFDDKGHDYNNAYYSPLSSSGLGAWKSTTSYPADVDSESCAIWVSTVYCVGGENATSVLSNVYEAPVTSSGIGKWTQAAAYPQTIAASSCFVYSGEIYCVGGFDITGDETASSYFASLSSGLTSWVGTTSYPFAINSEQCIVQGGYVYCIAGNEESGLPQFPITNVYYAQLSSSGIGTWTATTQYPDALSGLSCALNSGYVFCAGGFDLNTLSRDHVYLAAIGGTDVSAWTNSTAYPAPFDSSSCVTGPPYVYCIAGRTSVAKQVTMSSDDYYAALGGLNSTTSSTSETTAGSSSANSTTSTSSATVSTVPEFNGQALLVTTLVVLSSVALIFRIRAYRGGVRMQP